MDSAKNLNLLRRIQSVRSEIDTLSFIEAPRAETLSPMGTVPSDDDCSNWSSFDEKDDWSTSSSSFGFSPFKKEKKPVRSLMDAVHEHRKLTNIYRKAEVSVNLLKFNPSRKQISKTSKTNQWFGRKPAFGSYIVHSNRSELVNAKHLAYSLQSMEEYLSALKFCYSYPVEQITKFLNNFLRKFPRKYFFTSEELGATRAKLFYVLRRNYSVSKRQALIEQESIVLSFGGN